jgi:hypothetical protein
MGRIMSFGARLNLKAFMAGKERGSGGSVWSRGGVETMLSVGVMHRSIWFS